MRIGIVSPYSLTVPGGVQGQVLGLARALRERDQQVRVLGPCDGPPPDAGVTPLGNSLPTAANGSMAPIAPDPSAQLRTIRAIRDEDFDILHLHEPLVPGPTMTSLVLRPTPIVGTFHAAGGSTAYDRLGAGVRWLGRRIDRSVAVSEAAREMAQRAVGGDFDVLFNGVEIARYAGAQPHKADGPTIFFVARHEPRKGLEVLLDAMVRLPASVRLWVAGDGPETERLQRKVAGDPRIEWLGRLTEADKVARLRGADVFCAPSLRGESFGVVLLEAMAAEVAVVASDLDGYATVARRGADARLVTPGDVDALAVALDEVLFQPETAQGLIESGRQRAREFSMGSLADRYLAIYREMTPAR